MCRLIQTYSTLKVWPSPPFAHPIPVSPPWYCVLYFQNLGSTEGTIEQTTSILSNINLEVAILRAQRPGSVAFPFSKTSHGVHLELEMVEPTPLTNAVVIGALQVLYSYVRTYGGRDVSPLIMCMGVHSGTFKIYFVDSRQGAALISLPSNVRL